MEIILTPDILGPHVTAFFTGKNPGLDFGAIAKASRVSIDYIYLPIQKHTDKVLVVDNELDPKIADAVITHRRDILIGVQAADCVPILLHDRRASVVGAVHAGWKGTAAGIIKRTIEQMVRRFSSSPENIAIAIGPSIRPCCYEVGYEVAEAVERATGPGDYKQMMGEKYFIDLPLANLIQAHATGVPPENIAVSGDCTHCNPDRYYSYRYAKGPVGRQGGFIRLL